MVRITEFRNSNNSIDPMSGRPTSKTNSVLAKSARRLPNQVAAGDWKLEESSEDSITLTTPSFQDTQPACRHKQRMKNPSRNSIPTRGTLLSKIKDSDNAESWREFYSIYRPLIHGLARKMGLTDPEAEDAVQETFSHVSRNISKFNYDPRMGSFKSWLFTTSRWHINDQFNKRPKTCEPLHRDTGTGRQTSTAERVPDPRGNVLSQFYEEEWKQNLREAALQRVKERVNPKHYQAFYLHAVEAMPMDKITRLLGVTRNQVYLAKGRITRLVAAEVRRLDREIV